MRAAQAESSDDCEVKMKLVAPPLYVLTTYTLDKAKVSRLLVTCPALLDDWEECHVTSSKAAACRRQAQSDVQFA